VREVDETGDNFEQCLALLREVMRKVIEQHSLPDVFYIRSGHDEFIDLLQIGHLQFKKIPDLIDKKRAAKEINYLIQTLSKGEADTTRNKMIEDLKRQLAELKSK
jgi:hypothetical protein